MNGREAHKLSQSQCFTQIAFQIQCTLAQECTACNTVFNLVEDVTLAIFSLLRATDVKTYCSQSGAKCGSCTV